MTSESRQSSAKWVWTALLIVFGVCVLFLPNTATSAIEAVSFLERLASRAEKFSQLPAGNALRIAAAMRDGRYRHDIALRDPVLGSMALDVEAYLKKLPR